MYETSKVFFKLYTFFFNREKIQFIFYTHGDIGDICYIIPSDDEKSIQMQW